jgi:hypothetical protein
MERRQSEGESGRCIAGAKVSRIIAHPAHQRTPDGLPKDVET